MSDRDAWTSAGLTPPDEAPRTLVDWLLRAITPEHADAARSPVEAILRSVAEDLDTLAFYAARADLEVGELPGASMIVALSRRIDAAIHLLRRSDGATYDGVDAATPRKKPTAKK